MSGLGMPVLAGLVLFGLVAGVGITAVGPGGVLVTVGLFALTGLSPAQVAGTAIVTHVATGALATAAYTRSGQLRDRRTRRTAAVLAAAAVAGTPLGVLVNGALSGRVFGILLGVFVALVAVLVWRRAGRPAASAPGGDTEDAGLDTGRGADHDTGLDEGLGADRGPGTTVVAAVGFAVAVAGGVFGIGGPMLSVPLLVVLGVPVLSALAAAQAQSVVIAGVGTAGYVAAGAVDWPLAALTGVPEMAGVLLGWVIARAVPARALTGALIVSLFALAPYLALHG